MKLFIYEQDVEIEAKHKGAIDEDYVDGKYYDSHTLSRHWFENLTDYGRKQLYSTYNPLDFDAWVSSMLDKGYTKLDIMSFLLCIEEKSINNIKNWMSSWLNEGVEIDVKNEGILEVPEGKNVDDLPLSHFEKLAKKKGLSKITKALNNIQVWNKNDDPKLSKWAGDMIDKLNKKLKKDEAYGKRGRKPKASTENSIARFLDAQIDNGTIDEKQVVVVYGKNNNIMWLGKAGFYPLYMQDITYKSSGYDADHPHELWINARSYTRPFGESMRRRKRR